MYVCREVKNSQARTGQHRRGMGGRWTDDDDTHERHTDTNKLTRHTASGLPHILSGRTHHSGHAPPVTPPGLSAFISWSRASLRSFERWRLRPRCFASSRARAASAAIIATRCASSLASRSSASPSGGALHNAWRVPFAPSTPLCRGATQPLLPRVSPQIAQSPAASCEQQKAEVDADRARGVGAPRSLSPSRRAAR